MAKSLERLDKVLSKQGFGSRKDVKKLLRRGVVAVNGEVRVDPDFHVDLDRDVIQVEDETVRVVRHRYLMMNKPGGVVCSQKGGLHGTVFDLLSETDRADTVLGSLHLVGRLDVDTEGLLLLTTDGALTHRLISPKRRVPKEYEATLAVPVPADGQAALIERFRAGLAVPSEGQERGFVAECAELAFHDETHVTLAIYEGKYHQVKRMFSAVGNGVVFLKRVAEGKLRLDESVLPGQYRELTQAELALLV